MRGVALSAIALYQRHLSPIKGYRCAYGLCWGSGTCSGIVKRAFRTRGTWQGLREFVAQSLRCRRAYALLAESAPPGGKAEAPKGKCGAIMAELSALEGACSCCLLPFSLFN